MEKMSELRPNLKISGVPRKDPGWIYMIKNGDLIKLGKTVRHQINWNRRLVKLTEILAHVVCHFKRRMSYNIRSGASLWYFVLGLIVHSWMVTMSQKKLP